MSLIPRPSDAELLARLEQKRVPVPSLDRKCEYCRAPMADTDEMCQQCYRVPLEDCEQDDVRKLYLAYGCVVYSTSQKRRSKVSEGIPDLIVFSPRAERSGFHEAKRTRGGRLSPAQAEFRDYCQVTNTPWCAGGLVEARRRLVDWGVARWVTADGGDIEPDRTPR